MKRPLNEKARDAYTQKTPRLARVSRIPNSIGSSIFRKLAMCPAMWPSLLAEARCVRANLTDHRFFTSIMTPFFTLIIACIITKPPSLYSTYLIAHLSPITWLQATSQFRSGFCVCIPWDGRMGVWASLELCAQHSPSVLLSSSPSSI